MKKVIVMAMISIISYHASAQEQDIKESRQTAAAKKISATSGERNTSAKASKKSKVKPVIAAGTATETAAEGSTTLVSETEHQAKSRFHWMLTKRIKIDAENNTNGLKPDRQRKISVVNSRGSAASNRSETSKTASPPEQNEKPRSED